jgi:hypothetical protein
VISPIGAEGSSVRRHADDVFDYIIKPAVEECGLTALRSDHLLEPGKISEQMIREIVTGDCCIALLTGHNPNVFYELAVAQTVGTPVVAMIEKTETIPFDIHDLRCVRYDLSPRPLFERVYVKELMAHLTRLAVGGWLRQAAFGDLLGHHLARSGLTFELIAELSASWAEKRSALGDKQKRLLEIVERADAGSGRTIGQKELGKITGKAHDDDATYFRMEHLRLLGFIEKTRDLSDGTFRYALSVAYRTAKSAENPRENQGGKNFSNANSPGILSPSRFSSFNQRFWASIRPAGGDYGIHSRSVSRLRTPVSGVGR